MAILEVDLKVARQPEKILAGQCKNTRKSYLGQCQDHAGRIERRG